MNVKEPRYTNSGSIDLLIDHPEYGWIPFTASPDDGEEYGRELFAQAVAGEFGEVAEYVAPSVPVPSDEELAAKIRAKRNALIAASDWTQLPDAPLTDAQKAAWQIYRQALRDVTEQATFPQSVEWP